MSEVLKLGVGAYQRAYAGAPEIRLVNRFFETSPTSPAGASLLSRPATSRAFAIGDGPVRALFTQQGVFSGDLFVVDGASLFRRSVAGVTTPIAGEIAGAGSPSICAAKGPGYERVFIADGTRLQYYDGLRRARGVLRDTDAASSITTPTVRLGGVFYRFDSTISAGTGASGSPYVVSRGANDTAALANLRSAINATGVAGTTYSAGLVAHPDVQAIDATATTLTVEGRTLGLDPAAVQTTVTGSGLAWDATTLVAGGHFLNAVAVPDDQAVVGVATLAGFVIVVLANSQRFYFIRPGEVVIDALDFAEAEQEPDNIVAVRAVGDQLYLFGSSASEVWYPTGDNDAPFAPVQGRAFSRGVLPGTDVKLSDTVLVVADDGVVYDVNGLRRLSTHGVEELIRQMRRLQRENT